MQAAAAKKQPAHDAPLSGTSWADLFTPGRRKYGACSFYSLYIQTGLNDCSLLPAFFVLLQDVIDDIHPKPCIDEITMFAERIILPSVLYRFPQLAVCRAVPGFL